MHFTKRNGRRSNTSHLVRIFALMLLGLATGVPGSGQTPAPLRQYSLMPFHSHDAPLEIRRVRNLQTEHFVRDLEIEVKNVSPKPIYYIRLGMFFPDVKMNGKTYGFALRYGRLDLVDVDQFAGADDKPLQPGETYVFKVPDGLWDGFENYLSQNDVPAASVQTLKFRFDTINFGDGTGFVAGGDPYQSRKTH